MGRVRARRLIAGILAAALTALAAAAPAYAQAPDPLSEPWRDPSRALVLDAYEYNEIEWPQVVTDKRIAGFIGKATDGLPTEYGCSGAATVKDLQLCKLAWRRYAMSKELYHTRKAVAKALGLKWGAYHLARAGNPVAQADHFLDFARPEPDDLIALDIEENNPREFLSLDDAEVFARRVHQRIGRYPVLYTNGATAKYIADNKEQFPLLSRMRLWYARYKPGITEHFPKGHWQSYTLWQFVSHINCSERACPYRVPGTNRDIDVNVSALTVGELHAAWPFDGLEPVSTDPSVMLLAKVPVPEGRRAPHPTGTRYATAPQIVPVKSYLVPKPAQTRIAANTDTSIQTGSLNKPAATSGTAPPSPTASARAVATAYAAASVPANPFALAVRPAERATTAAPAKPAAQVPTPAIDAGALMSERIVIDVADRCTSATLPTAARPVAG